MEPRGAPAGTGAEQSVHHQPDAGPWSVRRHLADALAPGEPRHPLAEGRSLARGPGDPDRHVERVERASQHPPVAAVVPRARRDQHPIPHRGAIARGHSGEHRPAGALHEGGQLDTGGGGFAVPVRGLVGVQDGKHEEGVTARAATGTNGGRSPSPRSEGREAHL